MCVLNYFLIIYLWSIYYMFCILLGVGYIVGDIMWFWFLWRLFGEIDYK